MISEHEEIEAKFAADSVTLKQFKAYVEERHGFAYVRYEVVSGPDTYYEKDDAVVRHRMDRGTGNHELTVKRRKSEKSTRDRQEIDLRFSDKTSPEDVEAFLKATGFAPAFVLVKVAYIYHVYDNGVPLTVVYYQVWKQDTTEYDLPSPITRFTAPAGARTFIEVEAEKGSDAKKTTAKSTVESWAKSLCQHLGVSEPLNESLYEIYSGKRYSTV